MKTVSLFPRFAFGKARPAPGRFCLRKNADPSAKHAAKAIDEYIKSKNK